MLERIRLLVRLQRLSTEMMMRTLEIKPPDDH